MSVSQTFYDLANEGKWENIIELAKMAIKTRTENLEIDKALEEASKVCGICKNRGIKYAEGMTLTTCPECGKSWGKPKESVCTTCGGSGEEPPCSYPKMLRPSCPDCNGTGRVK